jgi:3-dehydroquinate synthase
LQFSFGEYKTDVIFSREIPDVSQIAAVFGVNLEDGSFKPLVIADENTSKIAAGVSDGHNLPLCLLKSGEENKNWQSVEAILAAAHEAGLGRDGVFIGIGGGVIGDLAGFAASVYMRGCRLALISTTLLGMVDASVGGKTGFDLFGIKNLAGSFYPACAVLMPLDSLATLPQREWKSGMAELIKTAVLDGDDFLDTLAEIAGEGFSDTDKPLSGETLGKCIERAVLYKGAVVTQDMRESGKRMLLNLGHTFGHALEAAAGLGKISHGEAVAWGMARACELGEALGVTPPERARKIKEMIASFGYCLSCPHPFADNTDALLDAMKSDKKKKAGKLTFIIPDEKSARIIFFESENEIKLVKSILKGEKKS